MAVDLARYIVSLEAQSAKYVQELDKANKKLDRFHKDQERALAKVKTAFFNFGVTLASALSVTAVLNFTKAAVQMGDELGETSRAAGVSAENLQELRFAFDKLGGIASGETDQGLQRFNRQLGLAINGSRQAQQQFKLLGVAFKDSFGRGLGTEATLEATLKALGEIENDAQRAAIASRLFGQELGPKLAAALKGGSQAMDDAREQVAGMISDQSVRQAEALDDAFKRMAGTVGGPLKTAAIGAAFEIAKIFGHVEDDPADALQERIKRTQEAIRGLETTLAAQTSERDHVDFLERLVGMDEAEWSRRMAETQRQLLQMQMNLSALQAAANAKPGGAAVRDLADGLEEVAVTAQRMGTPLDHVVAQFNQLFSAEGIEEVSATLVKMPDDLVKLSPAFNTAVVANQQLIAGLKETDKQQQQLAASMGASFQDAFTGWILGAERSFSDLLKRMAVEFATSAIFKSLGSLFPGGSFLANFFGGARANGGPVSAGKAYLVGERGPEMFIPSGSGMIAAAGGGAISFVTNIDARGADPSLAARLPKILADNNQRLKAEIKDKQRRGRF